MNSNVIYERKTDRTPYFYIIQHISSGKLYAGSRWAIGCYPAEFMKADGYCTSSKKIKKIIEAEGIESFRIHTLMVEDSAHASNIRCQCPHCGYTTSKTAFSRHAKKCFPKYNEDWTIPKSLIEWKKYVVNTKIGEME